MSSIRSELQEQAQNAIIQYAIFRWESAVVIAGTILLLAFFPHPFTWWPAWIWLLLGILGVAAIIYTSVTDASANGRMLRELYQERFNPRRIKDQGLRADVETALAYQSSIEEQVQQRDGDVLRERLEDTANRLSEWVANIYQLALQLDAYRHDTLLAREWQTVPQEVQEWTTRRAQEADSHVQQELDEVLESKQKQLELLQQLRRRMKRAELQMEQSLTALATIYNQLHLIDIQELDSGRSQRLQEGIQEQVERLNDLIGSINEVYDYHTARGGVTV
ncbi:MAG: hypothetical protein U9Q70_08075 [Chloroflexota bacterium]|nr:hypothetical protein [Chloroflexota bacterium]